MTCVSSGFRCSLLFALFVTSQTLAKPENTDSNSATVQILPHEKIEIFHVIKKQLTRIQADITDILKGKKTFVKANCAELYISGKTTSGVYTIDPDGSGAFNVFCDQTTAGGGWTVFQNRLVTYTVDFYRDWTEYKNGFGNLNSEFWLGLDKMHRLTKTTKNRLRVDLEDTTGNAAYAEYDMFTVTSKRTKYKLSIGTYSGTVNDSLSYHHGSPFTTKDQDNDRKSTGNCADRFKGGWWYRDCVDSDLNSMNGVYWSLWKDDQDFIQKSQMKIRPVNFKNYLHLSYLKKQNKSKLN